MPKSHQVEMKSRRLFEDFRLEASPADRIREVGVVGTAFDAVLASDITYISTPITSGAVLYRVMAQTGVKDADELRRDKKFFFENVIQPNIENADRAAQTILKLKGGAIIAPAAFEAKQLGWGQDEYMGLWFDVIEKKATRIVLLDGWEYSNGAAEEYLQALLMQAGRRDRNNIEILDERGDRVTQVQALGQLSLAMKDLLDRNIEPLTTARVLNRMVTLWTMVSSEIDYGQTSDFSDNRERDISGAYVTSYINSDVFRRFLREIRPVLDIAYDLLPESEKNIHSSSQLAPMNDHQGLVRREERTDLASQPAKITLDQEKPELKKPRLPSPKAD